MRNDNTAHSRAAHRARANSMYIHYNRPQVESSYHEDFEMTFEEFMEVTKPCWTKTAGAKKRLYLLDPNGPWAVGNVALMTKEVATEYYLQPYIYKDGKLEEAK